MPLKRKPTWETREFHDFLIARAGMPFVWGANDCCLFPADAIQAITGVDIAVDFRGKYDSETSAIKAILAIQGSTVADAAAYCAAKFGLVELAHPLKAQRGDLVTLQDESRIIAGVVGLTGHIVTVGEAGLKQIPITAVGRAWHY